MYFPSNWEFGSDFSKLLNFEGVGVLNRQTPLIRHWYRSNLNELKTEITAYIRNISQADLQKVFVNKIKRVKACIEARGHHFQHLL
jgi:hypothetical protein